MRNRCRSASRAGLIGLSGVGRLVGLVLLALTWAMPVQAQPIVALVTSDEGAAAVRMSLADVLLVLRQTGGDHFLTKKNDKPETEAQKTEFVGDVAFWSAMEARTMWIKAENWREHTKLGNRWDTRLLCAFVRGVEKPDKCREGFNPFGLTFALPTNFKVTPVATTRLVTVSERTELTNDMKTNLCRLNVGWRSPGGECVIREIPRQGGPYEHVRRCQLRDVPVCDAEHRQTEILLRVTSFAVEIDPPPDRRDEIIKRLKTLAGDAKFSRITIFASPTAVNNRADPPKPDSCVPQAVASGNPLKPEWLSTRALLSLAEQSAAFSTQKQTDTQVTIIEETYDKECPTTEALWAKTVCDKENSVRTHPFLLQGKLPPSAPLDQMSCPGPTTKVDHSVSVAGAVAGGPSDRFSVLPASFADHSKTRLAGSSAAQFPYKGMVPDDATDLPMVWLFPTGIAPPAGTTKIDTLLDKKFENGVLHKRGRMAMFVAAPYKNECGETTNDENWDVQAQAVDCLCYLTCLGRVDAAVVVAPLNRDGSLMQKATNGKEYKFGFSMVHVAAPGEGVIAPSYSGNNAVLRYRTGASIATGVAAAAAVLYWRFKPRADPNEVQATIFATSDITDKTLAESVRFGRINFARLMLPIEHNLDSAVGENRKRVVFQEVTPAGEAADAKGPATALVVDLSRGGPSVNLCDPKHRYLRLAERADGGGRYVCVYLKDLLRLRVAKGPQVNDPPLVTAVFWSRVSSNYTPVRVIRNWHAIGCNVMGSQAGSNEPPCVFQHGKTDGWDLRNKDILFPALLTTK